MRPAALPGGMLLALLNVVNAADLLIAGARLWDGSGGAPRENVDILVRGDRIATIGPALTAAAGARVLDARGATVLPGLIDSHVHLSMDPGAAWRDDSAAVHAELLAAHLRAYVACGVTTILDPGVLPHDSEQITAMLASGVPGPRYLSLGTPFSPPDGYVSTVIPGFPAVASVAEVERQLDAVLAQGGVGVKVTVEEGFVGPVWPLHAPGILRAIAAGAARHNLTVYVHAMSPREQRMALDILGARVFVHPLDRPHALMVAKIARARAYEMTTLSVYDALEIGRNPARLDDPLFTDNVPPAERSTARDDSVVRGFERRLLAVTMPALPLKSLAASTPFPRMITRSHLRRTSVALRAMRSAGVPVVMGSDAGNWPIIPFLFHGPTSIRELELIGLAGFTPAEALTAATRTPAEMLGLQSEIGGIRVGGIADLVVVDGDPLADLTALRHLRWTVRAGDARTPAEWRDPAYRPTP